MTKKLNSILDILDNMIKTRPALALVALFIFMNSGLNASDAMQMVTGTNIVKKQDFDTLKSNVSHNKESIRDLKETVQNLKEAVDESNKQENKTLESILQALEGGK